MSKGLTPRGLDHIVHAVRDLDALAELYRRLGFTVGARNRHAWGTHNHVVQLASQCFVELLTVAEPDKLVGDGIPKLFGRFNQDFIARHDGLSMTILESTDAPADAAAFTAAGIAAADSAMRFERAGTRADGSPMTVGFSLVFAKDPQPADAGFATCQQHFPENFWHPKFQDHPNTAIGIKGVVMTADNPSDHHIFLSAFVGERDLQATSAGLTVTTPRGEIQVMDATAFRAQFGEQPPAGAGARLAAMRFGVRDLGRAREALQANGIPAAERHGRLVVGPDAAFGATLVFEPG